MPIRAKHIKIGFVIGILSYLSLSIWGCKSKSTNSGLLDTVPMIENQPPTEVYHIGAYQYLSKYTSKEELAKFWNNIPSVGGKYGGTWRSGFYVSQHPAYNEMYGSKVLVERQLNDFPWMVKLRLANSCTKKSEKGRRWIDFLSDNIFSADDKLVCPIVMLQHETKGGKPTSPECVQILMGKLNDESKNINVGIVRDTWWPRKGFWYVKDLDCIEDIQTDADSVIEAAATIPEFWNLKPFTNMEDRTDEAVAIGSANFQPGEVAYSILVKALYESTPSIDKSTLESLSVTASKTDIESMKEPLKVLTAHATGCLLGPMRDQFKALLKARFLDRIEQSHLPALNVSDIVIGLTNFLNLSCRADDPGFANVDYWTLVLQNGCVKKGDILLAYRLTNLAGKQESKGFFTIGPGKNFTAGRTRTKDFFYYAETVYASQKTTWQGTDPKETILVK
ncbi:MAG: hypothetical protein NT027_03695, partial [Proteobacteria bacterium]|nr:hypothetical protein [Pseudomonadota bacterium]